MKQLFLLLLSLSLTILLPAQVSKTVNVTADGLSTALTATELSTITNLTLTGTINAVDIETIQNQMPLLTELDLSQATITATILAGTANFPANWFPGPSIGRNSLNYGGLNKPLLTSLQLPSTLEVIGSGGFSGCSGLRSITIPPTVTKIGWSAFEGCTGLTSLRIPPSVTYIDEWAFSSCSGLKEVTIPTSITSISKGMFQGCSGLTSLTIPSTVTSIGTSAFAFCSGLTSLVLPASVESIGNTAFMTCKNLASIYSYRPIPFNTANSFYDAIKSTCILYVPFGSKALYEATDEWKDFSHIVEMAGFKLSAKTAFLEAKQGSTARVELTGNVTWTASSDQPWLTVNPTSGTGDQAFTFTTANTSVTTRSATVIVSATGVDPQIIVATQQIMPTGVNETEQNMAQFKCYPNPFTKEIILEIKNLKHEKITVDIYNMAGQLIKNLLPGYTSEKMNLSWNGTNEGGQQVPSGVYICKVNQQSKQLFYQGK